MPLIELTIEGRKTDLGGFEVRRVLPSSRRRMVGPFIFFDHMGPAQFAAEHGIDVRPHPHIGLATVTYLFTGQIHHRDTLGSSQIIHPGAVNWMTAGRGIAHSERTDPSVRAHAHKAHGIQSWVALPKEYEETAPSFFHHGSDTLPAFTQGGADIKLIAGSAFGETSPVKTFSELFYVDVKLPAGATFDVPRDHAERAVYVVAGDVVAGHTPLAPLTMNVLEKDAQVQLTARTPCHLMLLGGAPFGEQRYIWWNFVSSDKDRIAKAKQDWVEEKFGKVAGDEVEFIPLPEEK